jgi:hypothetical protein
LNGDNILVERRGVVAPLILNRHSARQPVGGGAGCSSRGLGAPQSGGGRAYHLRYGQWSRLLCSERTERADSRLQSGQSGPSLFRATLWKVLAPGFGDCAMPKTSDRQGASHFHCHRMSDDDQLLSGSCVERHSFRVALGQYWKHLLYADGNPSAKTGAQICNANVFLDQTWLKVTRRLDWYGRRRAARLFSMHNRRLSPNLIGEGAKRRLSLSFLTASEHCFPAKKSTWVPVTLPPNLRAPEQDYQ